MGQDPGLFSPVSSPSFRTTRCRRARKGKSCRHGDQCQSNYDGITPSLEQRSVVGSYKLLKRNFRESDLHLLIDTLEHAGFVQAEHDSESFPCFLWDASSERPRHGYGKETRVNRLGGRCALAHKDSLQQSLRKSGMDELAPRTYIFPIERGKFAAEEEFGRIWIVKPSRRGAGNGIRLMRDPLQTPILPMVVCEYITNPLTLPYPLTTRCDEHISRYKVDLRMYVLVTSASPLRAYLHERALVRYAAAPYTLDESALCDVRVHVTARREGRERFCTFEDLSTYLDKVRGSDARSAMWKNLADIVFKALVAGCPEPPPEERGRRADDKVYDFELLGFDILLDERLRPWILEVNSQPDLSSCSPAGERVYATDHSVKSAVVSDMLNLVWSESRMRQVDFLGFKSLPLAGQTI